MNSDFVTPELAGMLEEIGFDEECYAFYDRNNLEFVVTFPKAASKGWKWVEYNNQSEIVPTDNVKTPTYSHAFQWLLDSHHVFGVVIPTVTMNWTFKTMTVVEYLVEVPPYDHVDAYDYYSYSEARLECLKQLVNIVKEKR